MAISPFTIRFGGLFSGIERTGSEQDDLLLGLFGADTLDGAAGDDLVLGNFGDDLLSGGAGDDRIDGGFGDDVIVGNTGNDLMRGGFGDDLMVWNNGDGSDAIDGGFGDDRMQVNFQTNLVDTDLQNDDVAEISADGAIRFARTELNGQSEAGLFQLEIVRTETLEVNFGGGSDTARLSGAVASEIALELDGGADVAGGQGFTLVNTAAEGVALGAGGALADLDAVLAEAEAGAIYFNAHSTDFPAGEVRGQLSELADTRDASGTGSVVFGALLDGGQEVQDPPVVTDAAGQGVVTFTVENGAVVSYTVSVTIRGVTLEELTVFHLHNAPAGENGPIVVDLLADAGVDPATPIAERDFAGTGFTATDLGDTLDLADLAEGVFVDLDTEFAGAPNPGLSQSGRVANIGTVSGGEETFAIGADDFEDARGTAFGDRLFGNAEDNVLEGLAGNDVFHAFAGNDVYDGGAGTDLALFNQAGASVIADLAAGIAVTGTQVNALISIEDFSGGVATDDRIAGDDGVNALNGNGGDDLILSRGGDDLVTGGDGADSFAFVSGDSDGAEEIVDFALEDRFVLDAGSFGVAGEISVQAVTAVDGVIDGIDTSANVFIVEGVGAATAARDALATAILAADGETEGAQSAFFIYFNEGQGRVRLFEADDIDQVGGALQHIANLGDTLAADDPGRAEALELLADLTEDNFAFDETLSDL